MSEETSASLPVRVPPVFIALAIVGLFLTYPLAVLPYGAMPLQHHLSFDATLLLVLISVAVVLGMRLAPPRWLTAAVALFCLSVVIAAVRGGSGLNDTIRLLGVALIPLAAGVVYHERVQTGERLVFVLAVLWLVQILLGIGAIAVGMEVVGFPGNRNWLASFTLALAPWAWLHVWRRSITKSSRVAWVVCLTAIALPTLAIVSRCESRGAWLALIVCTFLVAWCCLSVIGRTAAFIGVLLLVMLTVIWVPMKIAVAVEQDVRPPLWTATAKMISDRPLGIGPGRFTSEFTPYRVKSNYPFRRYAAAITLHPHNEVLNLAAVGGLIAGVAWLVLLLPVLKRSKGESADILCARAAVVVLVVHGMFDMVLVQPPGSLLMLLCLGICWSPLLREPTEDTSKERAAHLRRTAVSLAMLTTVLYGTHAVCKDLQIDRLHRRGYLEEVIDEDYPAALSSYAAAGKLAPDDPQWPLYAGSIALDRLQDADLALLHLSRGYQIDPRYGHVNQQLGKAYGMKGEHHIAMQYFEREVQLYPAAASAHRDLFSAALFGGAVGKLQLLADRIEALTRAELLTRVEPRAVVQRLAGREVFLPMLRRRAESWAAAVKAAQTDVGKESADALVPAAQSASADPLFYIVTAGQTWPTTHVRGEFNDDDFAYWQERLFFSVMAGTLDATSPEQSIAKAVSERIAAIVYEPHYTTPFHAWHERRGNTLSVGHLVSVLASHFDLVTIIHKADATELVCTLMSEASAHTLTLRADNTYDIQSVETVPPQGRLCFYPQEYFWRNLSLGTALGLALPDDRLEFHHVPTLQLMRYLQRTDQRLTQLGALADYIERAPIDLLYAEIDARRQAAADLAEPEVSPVAPAKSDSAPAD